MIGHQSLVIDSRLFMGWVHQHLFYQPEIINDEQGGHLGIALNNVDD